MEPRDVFFLGLGLTAPWTLVGQRLDVDKRPHELNLEVGAERGSRFACAECKRACKAHDFESFTWQHLNFFQHHCFITARVPRVDCPEHGVKRVQVPWARPGSHFTLLFEHAALVLVREMPVASAAGFMGITDKRLWRIVGHYVGRAVAELDLSGVRAFGLDETASKKGHNYVTVFIDMDRSDKPVIFVTPGKGKACVAEFRDFLLAHDGEPTNVAEVVCDMSSAFLAAVAEGFPKAAVTVDWFHVVQLFTTAVDDVRKAPFVRLRSPHPHAPQGHPLGGAESRRRQPHRRPAHCARRAGALSVITLFDGVGIEHFDGLGWRFGVATRSSVWLWSRFSSACRPLAKAERCVGCKRWVRANGAACGFVDNAARYPQLHRPISDNARRQRTRSSRSRESTRCPRIFLDRFPAEAPLPPKCDLARERARFLGDFPLPLPARCRASGKRKWEVPPLRSAECCAVRAGRGDSRGRSGAGGRLG